MLADQLCLAARGAAGRPGDSTTGRLERGYRLQAEQSAALLANAEQIRKEQNRSATLDERNRIAREIHDLLAHSLGALGVQIQAAQAVLTDQRDIDRAVELLGRARRMATDGLKETRWALHALRAGTPPLPEALADLSANHQRRYGAHPPAGCPGGTVGVRRALRAGRMVVSFGYARFLCAVWTAGPRQAHRAHSPGAGRRHPAPPTDPGEPLVATIAPDGPPDNSPEIVQPDRPDLRAAADGRRGPADRAERIWIGRHPASTSRSVIELAVADRSQWQPAGRLRWPPTRRGSWDGG